MSSEVKKPLNRPTTRDWKRAGWSPGSKARVFALVEAMFPPLHPSPSVATRYQEVVEDAEDFVMRASPELRRALGLTLFVLEWLAPIVMFRPARMSRMKLPARTRYLQRLEAGSLSLLLGLLVVAWKTVLTLVYFEHPDAAAELGYDGKHTRYLQGLPTTPVTVTPTKKAQALSGWDEA